MRLKASDRFDVSSAGIEPGSINQFVAKVLLEEHGIDIASKATRSIQNAVKNGDNFDFFITVCDEASAECCPNIFGRHQRLHWSFKDPSQLKGSDAEILRHVEIIKNQISR